MNREDDLADEVAASALDNIAQAREKIRGQPSVTDHPQFRPLFLPPVVVHAWAEQTGTKAINCFAAISTLEKLTTYLPKTNEHLDQCDQICRNFATLTKNQAFVTKFGSVLSIWYIFSKLWRFFVILGKIVLL